ncbi:MAG: GNAT family N-acetyltransferase [Anaerolineales bacterium]|nr:GNAT family N-acetyltransferase [Anaerolineales bacterium]
MPITTIAPTLTSRPMRDDADYWRMRQLLLDTLAITPIGFNWDMRRLDGQRFYNADLEASRILSRPVQLWETASGELVAYALPEGGGDDVHLQVHPDYRYIEEEMFDWAEQHLGGPADDGAGRQLQSYVYTYDAQRQQMLARRGYEQMSYGGMIRHLRLGAQPLAAPEIAAGYTLRTTDASDMADCQRLADLLNAAFGRDFHNALEYHNFTQLAPCFRQDLDLVAVAPDGSFAAYIGVPYDEANRWGIFEPVCTHPDHQRKGLARTLMQEGLLRLRALGAVDATVDTGDMVAANAFYTAMGFTEAYKGYSWCKRLA